MDWIRRFIAEGTLAENPRIFPVHRLDRLCSGILVFARGRKNANLLANSFRHQRVEKVYLALSDRKPKKKHGTIRGDMARSRRGTWKLLPSQSRPAVTSFVSLAVPKRRQGLRLYVLRPYSGKTHQLRVAMKSLAAPILGDTLYHTPFEISRAEERCYLHSFAIRFRLNQEEVSLIEPPDSGIEFLSEPIQNLIDGLGDIFAFSKERLETLRYQQKGG